MTTEIILLLVSALQLHPMLKMLELQQIENKRNGYQ